MKPKRILTALWLSCAWAFAAAGSARTTNTGNGGDSGVVIAGIADLAEPKPVASLISGTIPVGAYDVEILNASRTNWVDGELVVTYLNADAAVGKSFTLPRPTTGRLLAVGGGGAGGQDTAGGLSSGHGLPGGGGAGGLVISDGQEFAAAKYSVTVGAGGAEVGRKFEGETWKPTSGGAGEDGGDTVVRRGATTLVTAAAAAADAAGQAGPAAAAAAGRTAAGLAPAPPVRAAPARRGKATEVGRAYIRSMARAAAARAVRAVIRQR